MKIPIDSFSSEIVVRRSRFIAEGTPLDDPGAARERVAAVREAHPGSNHVVWAFLHGHAGETAGMSDDREPKGTAGRPVLEVIRGSGITNILITVTRYFGGTKLGTGGLVKAYSEAAKQVVAGIPAREYVERQAFRLVLSYDALDAAKRILTELDAGELEERFTDRVTLEGTVPTANSDLLRERIRGATSGKAIPEFPE